MTLISIIFTFLLYPVAKANCSCCNVNYKPQNCIPFRQLNLVNLSPQRDSISHPKQRAPFREGLWISAAPSDLYRGKLYGF
jgi:hypothetical protein